MSLADKSSLLPPNFEPFWFTMPEYPQAWKWKWLTSTKGKNTISWLPFAEQDKLVVSGLAAPFGGPDGGSLSEWIYLISELVDRFPQKSIQITLAPECYRSSEESDLVHQLLLRFGFEVFCEEQNFHVATQKSFDDLIHDSEKRRVKKARQYGVRFGVNEVSWERAHALISACRKRKGFPLSMSLDPFVSLPLQAPSRYNLFSVTLNEELLAVAVGVKVRSDILYFFLPGDDERFLNLSPMALLKQGMYQYCQNEGIRIFDYGIGTSSGLPNEGLIRFKRNMGGELSLKRTYSLKR
jgi:hypothetical protein